MKNIRCVITGDWHLRKDVPISRPEMEEEWINLQWCMVRAVKVFCEKKACDLIHTGDLFHKSQAYYGISNQLKEIFDHWDLGFFKIAGNHDLPYHLWENVMNSSWLATTGEDATLMLDGAFHFGTTPKDSDAEIIFTHQLVFPDEKSKPPMAAGKTAQELLDEFPNAKWIFTGDYHKAFHYEKKGRHVVNPGCLLRQSANEEFYDTGFYYVDTRKEIVEFHSLGDTIPMNTEHLHNAKERNDRIEAFMEIIEEKGEVSLSFTENLHEKLNNKKVPKAVKAIIQEIKEEIKL